ncbi:DUF1127 domain-containing protein [Algicella marina]|uniref:DUF1127 domain-containing protein n=1 Tax=Algicella marina TaxID=2683284 RepID=A0A6P1SX82_9RHOB|nr:DUF1127 domain-containing protein [Algicella marina]QHQ35058.1 DUF1127 domain-containing protein [Algicella marina]
MTIATRTTKFHTTLPAGFGAEAGKPAWLRVLDWLAAVDGKYRDARALAEMPDYMLDDIGLTRGEVTGHRR